MGPALLKRRVAFLFTLCAVGLVVNVSSAWGSHYLGLHLAKLNGHSVATVYYVDATDSSWPVNAAAIEWNRSSKVDAFRVSSCPSTNDYCVPVSQKSLGQGLCSSSLTYGVVTYMSNGGDHFSRSSFTITLCNTTPAADRRSVACQEEGHTLGLAHRPLNAPTCMVGSGSVFPNLPDGHDFDELGAIYNH